MTKEAQAALISIGTRRRGTTVAPVTSPEILSELKGLGFLGNGGGLTDKGSARREALVNQMMDELF